MRFYNVQTVERTLDIIASHVQPVAKTTAKPLTKAHGDVLAEPIVSGEHVPGFTRSTVDGYAVQAQDTYGSSETGPQLLQVSGEVHMGEAVQKELQPGQAMYIPTGGMLPRGSDAIIMVEYCEDMDGLLNTYRPVAPGENVIAAGEDVRLGEVLLEAGTWLRPQELGILAAVGVTEVPVYEKVKVGYLSSGDEIVPYHTAQLAIGEVRDMNEVTISAFAQQWGADIVCGGIVEDEYEAFRSRAEELAGQVDVLVLSGGSSIGTKDFTTEVIESLGDPGVLVHGVSVKPGKPTIFSMAGTLPVLGLPGHPASAAVIFQLFGEAIIRQRQGEQRRHLPTRILARVTHNLASTTGRADFIRVKLTEKEGEWWAEPVLGKSGLLSTLVACDALLEIPSPKEGVQAGEQVRVLLMR